MRYAAMDALAPVLCLRRLLDGAAWREIFPVKALKAEVAVIQGSDEEPKFHMQLGEELIIDYAWPLASGQPE